MRSPCCGLYEYGTYRLVVQLFLAETKMNSKPRGRKFFPVLLGFELTHSPHQSHLVTVTVTSSRIDSIVNLYGEVRAPLQRLQSNVLFSPLFLGGISELEEYASGSLMQLNSVE